MFSSKMFLGLFCNNGVPIMTLSTAGKAFLILIRFAISFLSSNQNDLITLVLMTWVVVVGEGGGNFE